MHLPLISLGLALNCAFLVGTGPLALRAEPAARPNIIVMVLDDLGYSDFGCYGGEVRTPHIDRLASRGVRFTQFYNAARCSPTRAALLTGLWPHQVGLQRNGRSLTRNGATIAELLGQAGYQTAMTGKWHLSETIPLGGRGTAGEAAHQSWLSHQIFPDQPFAELETYPINRGFQVHYGTIWGVPNFFDPFSLVEGEKQIREVGKDYYFTDAITTRSIDYIGEMVATGDPFFLYIAHAAPHWPLHARAEDINRYRGVYAEGWNALREARYARQLELGVIDLATHPLPELTGTPPQWETLEEEERQHLSQLMAVHAAMVDRVDQGLGAILENLERLGVLEETWIFILSDNGASPERNFIPGLNRPTTLRDGTPIQYEGRFEPGPQETWGYIGDEWASAVNTPYRYWKIEAYEGGIRTPLVVFGPEHQLAPAGGWIREPGHVIDLMPTILELAGVPYPGEFGGHRLDPLEGESLVSVLRGEPWAEARAFGFEHEGGRGIRQADWKLVAHSEQNRWQLFHLGEDATETRDLAEEHPQRVAEMILQWRAWAERVGVPQVRLNSYPVAGAVSN